MFPKLYKHLEEINESLKTGKEHSEDARELAAKISVQLELVNQSLLSQTRTLSQQQQSREEITATKRGKASFLQLLNFFMIGVGMVAIGVLSYYTFQLSKITKSPVSSEIRPSEEAASFRVPVSAFSAKLDELTDLQSEAQAHLAKLDSLIDEQTQSLRELKKLNTLAVRNFTNIRHRLYKSDSAVKTTQAVQTIPDSLSAAN